MLPAVTTLETRGITADTALRLGRLFKMSPQFWMRLQADWDLAQAISAAWRATARSTVVTTNARKAPS
jgi:plasmid maintenance system antidote protein VapI